MTSTAEESQAFRAQMKLKDDTYFTKSSIKWRLKHPVKYLIRKAIRNAKEYKLEMSLKEEDVVIPDVCPALGIPLQTFNGHTSTANSPSIDRFDNSKGYVKDNIRVVSWRANHLKSNGTLEEFRSLVKWMENDGKKLQKGN